MAETLLFPAPPASLLPLSLGGDCIVDFVRVDTAGAPIDYDPGTTVTLTIDDATPIVATAVISGEHAVARVESTVADALKPGLLWRCVASLPGSPSTEIVVGNGKTVRKDK